MPSILCRRNASGFWCNLTQNNVPNNYNYMKKDKSTETVLISLTQALKFLDMLEGHKSVRGLPSESQVYLSGIRAAVTIATEELED